MVERQQGTAAYIIVSMIMRRRKPNPLDGRLEVRPLYSPQGTVPVYAIIFSWFNIQPLSSVTARSGTLPALRPYVADVGEWICR